MPATKVLPPFYHPFKSLDLSSTRVVLWLNLSAIPLLLIFGWIYGQLIILLRSANPFPNGLWRVVTSFSGWHVFGLFISIILMLIFHELVHGVFFWIFSKERPIFALRSGYAFAAAPRWYLPKPQYVLVGLSPIIVISLLSIGLAMILPISYIPYLLMIATFNAAGALGDIIVVFWVLRQPDTILIRDQGDIFTTFSSDLLNSNVES